MMDNVTRITLDKVISILNNNFGYEFYGETLDHENTGVRIGIVSFVEYTYAVLSEFNRINNCCLDLGELGNRAGFDKYVGKYNLPVMNRVEDICIAAFDMDNQTGINEHTSHFMGSVICNLWNRILDFYVRQENGVVAQNGEELYAMIPTSAKKGCEVIRKAQKEISKFVFDFGEMTCFSVSATAGLSSALTSNTCNIEVLLDNAQQALYVGKDIRRGKVYSYFPNIHLFKISEEFTSVSAYKEGVFSYKPFQSPNKTLIEQNGKCISYLKRLKDEVNETIINFADLKNMQGGVNKLDQVRPIKILDEWYEIIHEKNLQHT